MIHLISGFWLMALNIRTGDVVMFQWNVPALPFQQRPTAGPPWRSGRMACLKIAAHRWNVSKLGAQIALFFFHPHGAYHWQKCGNLWISAGSEKMEQMRKCLELLITHRIHVWYIHLHLVDLYGKCRYHTWILWVITPYYAKRPSNSVKLIIFHLDFQA